MAEELDPLYAQIKLWIADGVSKKDLFDRLTILLSEKRVSDKWKIQQLQGFAAKNWHRAALTSKLQDNQELNTNERLDAAFFALNDKGIYARQNFTCCSSCGHGEAYNGALERREKGRPSHGYAFYHQQDTESAMAGYGLHIAFGALADSSQDTLKVGEEICQTFSQYGLAHEWEPSATVRIFIKPFSWHKQKSAAGALIPADKPWVILGHSDGRRWAGRIQDGHLEVRVRDDEGDVSAKRPRTREPHQELQRLLSGLLADGFERMHARDLPRLPGDETAEPS